VTPDELNALRAKACAIVRELGAVVDALDMAAESQRLPGDPAADAMIVHSHLDDAANAADSVATHATDLLHALEPIIERANRAAGALLAATGLDGGTT
jgi:hypothetical protein